MIYVTHAFSNAEGGGANSFLLTRTYRPGGRWAGGPVRRCGYPLVHLWEFVAKLCFYFLLISEDVPFFTFLEHVYAYCELNSLVTSVIRHTNLG